MRSIALLISRLILGGYLIVHGAQKLFGAFGGRGLDGTAQFFESIGLEPGRPMAALAGASELGGGVLTATGIAYPLGPLMVASTMAVASTTHRANGALASDGGFELPLTNLAVASALAAAGPGKLRLGSHLPKPLTTLVGLAGAASAGYVISQILGWSPGQSGVPAPSPAGRPGTADIPAPDPGTASSGGNGQTSSPAASGSQQPN